MLSSPAAMIVSTREKCAVCQKGNLKAVIDLPDLPLTGRFSHKKMQGISTGIDQRLLWCPSCSHAQLTYQVDPEVLYDESYSFRTSLSQTARNGTAFFLKTLQEIAGPRTFQCMVDLGCNDLFLLQALKDRCRLRYGIDPIWKAREKETLESLEDPTLTVIGEMIEEVDLKKSLKTRPDLIVLRHTLEHLWSPKEILEKLLSVAAAEALFLIEIPMFEALLARLRFDQIFNQHFHYFSWNSFRKLLEKIGCKYLGHRENYHDWGVICVAFAKEKARLNHRKKEKEKESLSLPMIQQRYEIFLRQMALTRELLMGMGHQRPLYGYGASQMLPVLAYHLKTNLSRLECILDDDPAKEGLWYANLPLVIKHSERIKELENADVLVTAIDHAVSIISRLSTRRPRHVVYPLMVM